MVVWVGGGWEVCLEVGRSWGDCGAGWWGVGGRAVVLGKAVVVPTTSGADRDADRPLLAEVRDDVEIAGIEPALLLLL